MELGSRMKMYEGVTKIKLTRRMPVIIRVDGKAFHTLTRNLDKPYDTRFESVMNQTALMVAGQLQNCILAYLQSDEVSFLLIDYKTLQTEPWFGNDLQKMVSISAALMSIYFNSYLQAEFDIPASFECFDSRAFCVPKDDVCNYFVWRQQDATRNSIQGLAQKYFSHKKLHKKNTNQLQDLLMLEKGINWNDLPPHLKRGRCFVKTGRLWNLDINIPIFTQDRNYIEKYLEPEET